MNCCVFVKNKLEKISICLFIFLAQQQVLVYIMHIMKFSNFKPSKAGDANGPQTDSECLHSLIRRRITKIMKIKRMV
jgi:hypothetical protein